MKVVVTAVVEATMDMVVAKKEVMVVDAMRMDMAIVEDMAVVATKADVAREEEEDMVMVDLVTQEAAMQLKETGGLRVMVRVGLGLLCCVRVGFKKVI
ncbi:hypothetical protein CRYUN_Cryun22dG0038600 [Craigia yunnanensis]